MAVKALYGELWGKKPRMDDPTYWAVLEGDSRLDTPPYDHVEIFTDEVDRVTSRNTHAPILDVGCNAGRLLQALYERGYANLSGVDVQKAALEHMARLFPDMAAKAHIKQASFQEFFPAVADRTFEVVCTWGATIELVPPAFPICQQMARVAGRAVIILIKESGYSYPRLWETEFLRAGFLLTRAKRPYRPGTDNSLLVFERMAGVL